MGNENSGNGNGWGSGGGGNSGSGEGRAGPDDETVVSNPDEFVLGVLARFPRVLRRLADRFDQHREAVRSFGLVAVIRELRDEVRDSEVIFGGTVRAMDRLIFELEKKGKKKP